MDRLIDRLPSPAGLALWLYAAAFVILPALLAYKGFAYVVGIVIFAVGVRPHVESLVAGHPVHFAFHWGGQPRSLDLHLAIRNERHAVKLISWALMALTVVVLPLVVYVLQAQGQIFYAQIETQLPQITAAIADLLDAAHQAVPGAVPDVEVRGAGWEGLSSLFAQVAGDAVTDVKNLLKSMVGTFVAALGTLVGDWVKLIMGAIIVGTILAGWEKEVAMHRGLVARGIRDGRLRRNVLRYGELYQTGVSLFMIGYLEVAATLSVLYGVAMAVLPLGLGPGAIVFMAVVLGVFTAIPKIGGFLGMGVAFLLMATNLEPGLGWFGWTVVSFGWGWDAAIRTGLLVALAKVMGLLEAYSYTPEIVGRRLGMTKMQIIATVMIWAVGAGFFGMIWGILISLAFQAALRLAQEAEAEAEEDAAAAPADAPPLSPAEPETRPAAAE